MRRLKVFCIILSRRNRGPLHTRAHSLKMHYECKFLQRAVFPQAKKAGRFLQAAKEVWSSPNGHEYPGIALSHI
jgi:hypothetical protein